MDPLAQLHDIQTPEPIGTFPLAIGWYLLIAIIVLLVVFLVRHIIKQKRLKKNQKQALSSLENAQTNQAIMGILKWAALAYFPRQQVAHLHSSEFFDFLNNKLPVKKQLHFQSLSDNHFESLYQQQENDSASLKSAAHYWLVNALPNSSHPKNGGKHV